MQEKLSLKPMANQAARPSAFKEHLPGRWLLCNSLLQKFFFLFLLSVLPLFKLQAQTTYTWTGAGANTDWGTAANWDNGSGGGRTTPATTDIIKFPSSLPSVTVTNVLTQTIGQLILESGITVTFKRDNSTVAPVIRNLTINGDATTGDDLIIPATSTLKLDNTNSGKNLALTFSLTQTPTPTGIINGTLELTSIDNIFSSHGGNVTVNGTIKNSGQFNNDNAGTATTLTIGSSGKFVNSNTANFKLGASNQVVVIGTFENSSTGTFTSSATTFQFNSGSFYNHKFTTTAGTIPTATWSTGSTVSIEGYTDCNSMISGIGQTFSNFTWNCPNQNSGKTPSINVATMNVAGKFKLISTGNGSLALSNGVATPLSVKDYEQTGGKLDLSVGATAGTLKVTGTFNQSGGTIIESSSSTTNSIEFNGNSTQNVTFLGTVSNQVNYTLNNTAGIILIGNLQVNDGATLTLSNASTSITTTTNGTVTYTGNSTLVYNSATGPITTSDIEFPFSNCPANLTINNTAASNNIFTLPGSRILTGTLKLTSGLLKLGAYDLTIGSTGSILVPSPSNSSMIVQNGVGRLYKTFGTGASPTFTYPIGEETNVAEYSPVSLTFSANGLQRTIGVTVTNATHSSIDPLTETNYLNRFWTISDDQSGNTSANNTYSYTGTFTYTPADVAPGGTAANIRINHWDKTNLKWTQLTSTSALNVLSITATQNQTSASLGGNDFAGRVSQTNAYTWNGSNSTDWSNVLNWTSNNFPATTTPTGSDDVTIDGSVLNQPIIGSGVSVSVNKLDLSQSGASLQVLGNAGIAVGDAFTYNSTGLILDPTSTFTYGNTNNQTIYALQYGNLNAIGGDRTLQNSSNIIKIAGAFTPGSGTYTTTGSTVEFNGSSAQAIPALPSSATYNNLIVSNTTTVTLGSNIGVSGTATVNNGTTLDMSTKQITGAGNVAINGILKTANVNGLSGSATTSLANSLTGITLGSGSTIEYNGTGAQTITARTDYYNLTISGARGNNSITLPSGTVGVAKTYDPSATSTAITPWVVTGNTIDFTSSGNQTIPAGTYNNLTSTGNGTRTLASLGTVYISGIFNPGTGAYTTSGSTVEFNGSAAQTIPALSYNNLTSSSTGGRTLPNGGIVQIAGTYTPNSNTFTVTGSTVEFNGTGQTIPAGTYNNLTVSGSGSCTLKSSGTIKIAGTFNPGSGTYIVTGSTIDFNGTGAQTIPAFTYNSLTFSSTGNRTLPNPGTIKIAGTFNPGATNTYTVTGGTVEFNGTGSQTIPAFSYHNLTSSSTGARTISGVVKISGIFTPGSNSYTTTSSTIEFNGSGNQDIPAFAYNNLTSSSTGARTLSPTGNIKIKTTFTPGTNVYTVTGSTVEFNGSAAANQFIPVPTVASGGNYHNLTVNSTAGTSYSVTFSGSMTIAGDFTQSLTNTTPVQVSGVSANNTISILGNLNVYNGSFRLLCHNTSTGATVIVENDLTISGNSAINLENIVNTIANSRALLEVKGNFTSTVSTAVNVVDFGASDVANNEVRFGGNLIMSGAGRFGTNGTTGTPIGVVFNKNGVQTVNCSSGVLHTRTIFTVNSGSTIALASDFTMTGTSSTPAAKFIVNGTLDMAGKKLTGGGANNSLIVNPTGVVKTGIGTISGFAEYTVDGACTVEPGGTMDLGTAQISGTGTGTMNINGTLKTANANGLSGGTNTALANTQNTLGPASTIEYNKIGAQTISVRPDYQNLTISGSDTKTLDGDINVKGALTMTSGILQTEPTGFTYKVILDANATLVETNASYVTGTVESEMDMDTPGQAYTFNGIGLSLTPAGSNLPGNTKVIRKTGTPITEPTSGNQSIKRYYDIIPTTNANLNVAMEFQYLNAELNGILPANLVFFKSTTGINGPWTPQGGTPGSNKVTLSGITDFSTWTLGSSIAPLPVELVSFEAKKVGTNAALTWATASEHNSQGFEVQVSNNGKDFRKLGFVESRNGNTMQRYSFTDVENGKSGIRYYRLKQIDFDGKETYFASKAVRFDAEKLQVNAYPNPFQNEVNLAIQATETGKASLRISDLSGKTVLVQDVNVQKGNNKVTIGLDANMPAGVYLLQAQFGSELITTRLLKK